MPIAEEQQRAWMIHAEVERDTLAELAIVHVAAPRSEISRAERLFLRRRDSNTSEHRFERNRVVLHVLRRLGGTRHAVLTIESPLAGEMLIHFQIAEIARSERAWNNPGSAVCRTAIQTKALQMHDQGIAGPRAFDIERSRQGIAATRAAGTVFINAPGVHALSLDCVARENVQRRRDIPSEVIVEGDRLELMRPRPAGRRRKRAFSNEGEWAFEVGAFPPDLVA